MSAVSSAVGRSKVYVIGGVRYHVHNSGNEQLDSNVAECLHEIDVQARQLIDGFCNFIDLGVLPLPSDLASLYTDARLATICTRLRKRYNRGDVYESYNESPGFTSYVINQGEELHMCIRGTNGLLESPPTLIAVLTHELAHIASSTPGHDTEFWENTALLRSIAQSIHLLPPDTTVPDTAIHCGQVTLSKDELLSVIPTDEVAYSSHFLRRPRTAKQADTGRSPMVSGAMSGYTPTLPSTSREYAARSARGVISGIGGDVMHPDPVSLAKASSHVDYARFNPRSGGVTNEASNPRPFFVY
jgi:hypothetical protein